MTQLTAYRKEIFHFLSTIAIKFDILGQLRNRELQYSYEIDLDDRTTWAYYLNLSGQYHASNQMMRVVSIDTGAEIDFTITNLNLHPKTKLVYRPGTKYYKNLLKQYPTQVDLIRSIVYPVDINTAIVAEDFTLLTYDDTYLDSNEKYDLVEYLRAYILKHSERWYIEQYNYEELHPIAYWCILYYNLPLALFAKRLSNLHTANVHMFHVWEYLTSNGLANYKNILTVEQSLFLYRNLKYIYKNRGKESTLLILAENILKPLKVAVFGKKIHQNNVSGETTQLWTPEILSDDIVDYTQPSIISTNFETIDSIQRRLYIAGLDTDNTIEYFSRVNKRLATTTKNMLPTKLVEIVKYILDNKYQNLLNRFIMETYIQRIADGLLQENIILTHDRSGIEVVVPIQDVFIMLYYAIYKEREITPIDVPNCITMNTAYTHNTTPTISLDDVLYFGNHYNARSHVDIDGMVSDIRYDNTILNTVDTTDLIADQFTTLIEHIRYTRASGNTISILAVEQLYKELIPIRHRTIELSEYTTYADWLSNNDAASIITAIDSYSDSTIAYGEYAEYLFKVLFPMQNLKFRKFLATNDDEDDGLYKGLKNLFTQLCSYHITFLDTNRDNLIYYFLSNITMSSVDEITDNTKMTVVYDDLAILDGTTEDCPYPIDPVDVGIEETLDVNPTIVDMLETPTLPHTVVENIRMPNYLEIEAMNIPTCTDTTYVDPTCEFALD